MERCLSTPESVVLATDSRGKSRPRHRRSLSIGFAGEIDLAQLQKMKEVEDLYSELECKKKALEESQEEACLAARIGQTLLERNEEMNAEIESTAIEV